MVLLSLILGAPTSRRNTLRVLSRHVNDVEKAYTQEDLRGPSPSTGLRILLHARGIDAPLEGEDGESQTIDDHGDNPSWEKYLTSLHPEDGKDTNRLWKLVPFPNSLLHPQNSIARSESNIFSQYSSPPFSPPSPF